MAKPITNSMIFGVIMIITQVVIATMNGVFIRPIQQNNTVATTLPQNALFEPFVVALLTVLGFGLIFSYNRKLLFTGLGFAFFIFAFVLQLYPLINAFWTKTQIMGETIRGTKTPLFDSDIWHPYYLSRSSTTSFYENHVVQSFKCAIAIIVAFSCIIGRAGQLETWILVAFGTVGFELNRQVLYRTYQTTVDNFGDPYGTMNVFVFGGFMGLAASFILSCRQKDVKTSTAHHGNYTANGFSAAYALLGTAILSISLPFLIFDWHNTTNNRFSIYTPVLCILLSISGSTIASMALGLIFYGRPIVRHLVYGPIAGAVIGGASSYYTSNPVYAIVVGVAGGLLQTIFMTVKQYFVDTKGYRPFTSVSFTLFGIQGIVGAAFAVGWKQIIQGNSTGLTYIPLQADSHPLILYGLICAGFGLGFGIITGILIVLVNGHNRHHHFADRTYWVMEDGISQALAVIEGSQQYFQGDEIKNQHAYL